MKKTFKLDFRGKELIVEIGEVAKQAQGSVIIRYGDTVVLSTVCVSKNVDILMPFFPLMVLYEERLYSVGKIPGGFIKREGRPTDNATLAARMIDRPLRPLFPDDFKYEVQVVNTILSVDNDNSPELAAMFGSSLAVSLSKIPFAGPVAGVKVARVDSEFIINPSGDELAQSDIDLTVAGTGLAINMVEASANEVGETVMVDALAFGHSAIKELTDFQEKIIKELGQEKMEYSSLIIEDEFKKEVDSLIREDLIKAFEIKDKQEKNDKIRDIRDELISKYKLENKDLDSISVEMSELIARIKLVFEEVETSIFRSLVIDNNTRIDGRKMDELRDLSSSVDFLPRAHGSALFTRGQTQALSTVTLGALGEHQILDGVSLEDTKRFMLHYNFPQFSVGETGRYSGPNRRAIGHGMLGEKALLAVMPDETEFPYTVRVVSEILESNGSSSQASICAGSLALMAAGVPIKAPVAGIAMGLMSDGKTHKVLTDIQGMEDFLGDMDFKVAGTKKGICALQMDIKIDGVTKKILKEALDQAKKARLEILDSMEKTLLLPREEVSKYAPKTVTFMIDPAKIKDVIGKGGETITKIILEASNVSVVNDVNAVKVDLADDGQVIIYHTDQNIIDKTEQMIRDIVREVIFGELYTVKIVSVLDFGAFAELWPGVEGLIHVSELDHSRIEKASDVVSVGDVLDVKSLGYDKRGRLNLSRKALIEKQTTDKE